MAANSDESTLSTSQMFPFAAISRPSISNPLNISTPYNPLTHWGNISSLRHPYSSLNHASITRNSSNSIQNTEEDENSINNYHNPRTKHYQQSMDKQRLEHILFSGDISNSLNQQKERMRQKLLQKNKRKNNKRNANTNTNDINLPTQINTNGHNNNNSNSNNNIDNNTKKTNNNNNFTQQKKNKKNKNKNHHTNNNKNNNGNKKKHGKQKNKHKKNKHNITNGKKHNHKKEKAAHCKSQSHEPHKTNTISTDSNSNCSTNSVHIIEFDNNSIYSNISNQQNERESMSNDTFNDGDGESDSIINQHENELICNGHTSSNDNDNDIDIKNEQENMCQNDHDDINEPQKQECPNENDTIYETIESQNKEIAALKQNVFVLSEMVNKLQYKLDELEENKTERSDVQKEILSLKKRVNDIECMSVCNGSNNNNNVNHEQVRQWLKNEVGLEQYYHIFIDNGFEDMLSVKTLNMEILNNIKGIDKIGHKSKILYFVTKLNQCIDSTHEF